MVSNVKTLVLTAVLLLVCYTSVEASYGDPQVIPEKGPFIDGWWLHLLDSDVSIKAFWAVFMPNGSTDYLYQVGIAVIPEKGAQPYLAETYLRPDEARFLLKDGQPVTRRPDYESPTNCTFYFGDVGHVILRDDYIILNLTLDEYNIQMRVKERVPFDNKYGAKTQQFLYDLPLEGIYYIVSVLSPVESYSIHNRSSSQEIVSGQSGVAYYDRTWQGIAQTYVWAMGQAETPEHIFVMGTIYEFEDNGNQIMWAGYRNYDKNITSVDFRDFDTIYEFHYNTVSEVNWFWSSYENCKYRMVFNATAPAVDMWNTEAPGLDGSLVANYYDAMTADVNVIVDEKNLNGEWVMIDQQIIPNSVFQCGGRFNGQA